MIRDNTKKAKTNIKKKIGRTGKAVGGWVAY